MPIMCDYTSAINLTRNPLVHSRAKQIEIHHHFIRNHISGHFCVYFIDYKYQLADIFVKPLEKTLDNGYATKFQEIMILAQSENEWQHTG